MTFQNIMAGNAIRADELSRTVQRARDNREMQKFVVTAADLPSMTEIARVSSREPVLGKQSRWTELAIYYRAGWTRPYIAVTEGKSIIPGEKQRFQYAAMGTLERAVNWFEGSRLRDELAAAIPADWAPPAQSPGAAERLISAGLGTPEERAAAVGYRGDPTLTAALAWLYGDAHSDRAHALAFERDFGVPERTTRNTLSIEAGRTEGKVGPWLQPFLAALRYFDWQKWTKDQADAWEKANG
jgi:hypothetical protein